METPKNKVKGKTATKKTVKKKAAAKKAPSASNKEAVSANSPVQPVIQQVQTGFREPLMAYESKASLARSGFSTSGGGSYTSKNRLAGELNNIDSGVTPFDDSGSGIDVKDAVELCRKAYWNVAIFRMTIDIMTEFTNSKIHWRGGDASSLKFFKTWYERSVGWAFNDQFFREYYRGSNDFIYRIEALLNSSELRSMSRAASVQKIPVKYLLLDAAEIKCNNTSSFSKAGYYKVLNKYEAKSLKNASTDEEKALLTALPSEVREAVEKGKSASIPLPPEDIITVFAKKQDYEPLAVPMFFPVLFDINLKLQFKKAEHVIAKAVDYCILLITMGTKPEEGGVNQVLLDSMSDLFSTESVGRVLVSDYTTKMEFVIPDLNKILGSEKYKVVNQDINSGLLNIFFGEDKFANASVKIQVFLERLKEARKAYLEGFLLPEMKRISKRLGFQNPPTPEFEEIDLKDEVEYFKIYNRLAELGYLTPEETFEAYKSHKLPLPKDSEKHQEEFLKKKEEGLYAPLERGSQSGEAGRPTGGTNKVPPDRKVGPIGASVGFAIEGIKATTHKMDKIIEDTEKAYKSVNNIKRLSKKHKEKSLSLAKYLMSNVPIEEWESNIENVLKGSVPFNAELNNEMEELSEEHQIKDDLGLVLLVNSKVDLPKDNKSV